MFLELSKKVKTLRIKKGWTQERLALIAGLSYRTVQRVEKDGHCSLDSKMALALALDISLYELTNDVVGILDSIYDLAVFQDGAGIYKSIHTRSPELLCKPQEQIIGNNYADILPIELSEKVSKAIDKLKSGDRSVEFNYQLAVNAGQQYFNVKMVQAEKDSFLSLITETSQQHAEEQKQLKNEELLAMASDTLRSGAWEVDLITMDRVWTKQVYEIYELEEMPSVEECIEYYAEAARPVIQQAFTNLIKAAVPFDLKLPFVTVKGKRLVVRVTGQAHVADTKVIKVSGVIQDVTHL